MEILFILFLILVVFVVLDIAAMKWGFDSRSRREYRSYKDKWVGEQREPRSA